MDTGINGTSGHLSKTGLIGKTEENQESEDLNDEACVTTSDSAKVVGSDLSIQVTDLKTCITNSRSPSKPSDKMDTTLSEELVKTPLESSAPKESLVIVSSSDSVPVIHKMNVSTKNVPSSSCNDCISKDDKCQNFVSESSDIASSEGVDQFAGETGCDESVTLQLPNGKQEDNYECETGDLAKNKMGAQGNLGADAAPYPHESKTYVANSINSEKFNDLDTNIGVVDNTESLVFPTDTMPLNGEMNNIPQILLSSSNVHIPNGNCCHTSDKDARISAVAGSENVHPSKEHCSEKDTVDARSRVGVSVKTDENIDKVAAVSFESGKNGIFEEGSTKATETNGMEYHKNEIQDEMTNQTNSGSTLSNQEKHDPNLKRPELVYRNGAVNSDDDTSSTMFSSPDVGFSEEEISDAEVTERLNARKVAMSRNKSRTEGEIFPEELPPLEYLTISPDEGVELEPIGTVSGVVDVLVVVKANSNSPALYDDTVLFLEDRDPLGLIFETFGTVDRPFYSVRFNSNKDIQKKGISVGDKVLFAPRADNLTKYVFIAELRKIKCDDASWENDNEPPAAHVEFSDDEEEKRAVRRHRNKDRGQNDNGDGISGRRKKRKKRPNMERMNHAGGPQLLQGELNKNPFGNKGQMFNPPASKQWPPKDRSGQKGNVQCFQQPPLPPFAQFPPPSRNRGPNFNTFTKPQPPFANFGEKPQWNNQAGLLGQAPPNTVPGGFSGNGNVFNSPHPFQAPSRFSGLPFPPQSQCSSGLNPHNMNMQPYMFGPYNPSHPMQHFPSVNPPLGINNQGSGSAGFPVFNPSHPPPSISSIFRPPPPPPPTSK